ncbi:MAG: bacterial proteasome activator family protein [Actinobacteria bacterium]|nr:bacterial proteasome activator family protein [Actinomycetota bacterium]
MEEPVTPEVVEAKESEVSEPTKLIRIAAMTRAMLEEARTAPLDDRGRIRLAEVHARSVAELKDSLSPDLQEELKEIMIPLSSDGASESEVRVAQAQLIGWLEGLFHGIQASLWSQQMMARSQLEEMQKRALNSPGQKNPDDSSGLYL